MRQHLSHRLSTQPHAPYSSLPRLALGSTSQAIVTPTSRWALSLGSSGGDDLALCVPSMIGTSNGEVPCSGENSGAGVHGVWGCANRR